MIFPFLFKINQVLKVYIWPKLQYYNFERVQNILEMSEIYSK